MGRIERNICAWPKMGLRVMDDRKLARYARWFWWFVILTKQKKKQTKSRFFWIRRNCVSTFATVSIAKLQSLTYSRIQNRGTNETENVEIYMTNKLPIKRLCLHSKHLRTILYDATTMANRKCFVCIAIIIYLNFLYVF